MGDRYVMEMLQEEGWCLGGESSGHVISLDRTTTGDGIVTALQVLLVMTTSGQPLSELKAGMTKYPQILVNVPIAEKINLSDSPRIQAAVREVEQTLGERGRVLLRPSGTEPLVRVMVEGDDGALIKQLAEQIAEAVTEMAEAG